MSTFAPLIAGTPITWTSSGGTNVLSAASLANGSAVQGDKSATLVDATKGLPALLEIVAETQVQAAPTDGNTVDIYAGFSSSATAGTDNPGGLTGAHGTLSSPASVTSQLLLVGSLVMSNAIGTGTQRQRFLIRPQDAYMIPVLVNNSGQTVSATGTVTIITLIPFYQQSS